MGEDPYAVLGVAPGATAEEARQAYFRMVRTATPEAQPEAFKRIRAAYETLRSPLRRMELELERFDDSAAEVDLDLLSSLAPECAFDAASLLLALEWNALDLTGETLLEDLTLILEQELLGK